MRYFFCWFNSIDSACEGRRAFICVTLSGGDVFMILCIG